MKAAKQKAELQTLQELDNSDLELTQDDIMYVQTKTAFCNARSSVIPSRSALHI